MLRTNITHVTTMNTNPKVPYTAVVHHKNDVRRRHRRRHLKILRLIHGLLPSASQPLPGLEDQVQRFYRRSVDETLCRVDGWCHMCQCSMERDRYLLG
jgi:hypothetical protein